MALHTSSAASSQRSLAAVLVLVAGLACCGQATPHSPGPTGSEPTAPPAAPVVPEESLLASAAGGNDFAFELLRRTARPGENAVMSPLSIRHALALAWAGAAGATDSQMRGVLGFEGAESLEHAALAAQVSSMLRGEGEHRPEVSFASRVWVQAGFPLADGYQERLESAYGSAFEQVDFRSSPDRARRAVNSWVEDQTRDRIVDLLPDGSVHADTRLILANAVYLEARWANPFAREATRNASFTLADGQSVSVPTMHDTAWHFHAVTDEFTAIEMRYRGSELAMVVIMPTLGSLEQFESGLDAAEFERIVGSLQSGEVVLSMPRFEFETMSDMRRPLIAMGMEAAFSDRADFSRMSSGEGLQIGGVFHGAFLRVDEAGTEAAAATAVTMEVTSAPPMSEPTRIEIDRPFVLAIRDRSTGAILFLGRVADPR